MTWIVTVLSLIQIKLFSWHMGIDWRNCSDHDAEKDNVLTFLSLEFILQMAVSYHSKCIGWLAIFFINTVESTFKTIYLSYCYILESCQKINGEKAICFGAKDNQYGSFRHDKEWTNEDNEAYLQVRVGALQLWNYFILLGLHLPSVWRKFDDNHHRCQ